MNNPYPENPNAGYGQQPPYAQQVRPQKSGCARFWWLFLLIPLVLIGSCAGVLGLGFRAVKAPVYAAVKAANENPEVTAKLGRIKSELGFSGDMNVENGNGSANVDFRAVGADGTARIEGKMKMTNGQWSAEELTVTCGDGTIINVP